MGGKEVDESVKREREAFLSPSLAFPPLCAVIQLEGVYLHLHQRFSSCDRIRVDSKEGKRSTGTAKGEGRTDFFSSAVLIWPKSVYREGRRINQISEIPSLCCVLSSVYSSAICRRRHLK